MKAIGKFVAILRTRNNKNPQPEGHWEACLMADETSIVIADEVKDEDDVCYMNGVLQFASNTGKTGGTLHGCFIAPNVFVGQGKVWGCGACHWQEGGLFAPSTANVTLFAISPQSYCGSLPNMAGQPIQTAKAVYDTLNQQVI